MTLAVFHDFPGLENSLTKFHDFPGRVVTLKKSLHAADSHNCRDNWNNRNVNKTNVSQSALTV